MITPVYIASHNIVSPLGNDTRSNFENVRNGISGISRQAAGYFAAVIPGAYNIEGYTNFESLLITSINGALAGTAIRLDDARTALVISTTKGNIALLEQGYAGVKPMQLFATAEKVAKHFGAVHTPYVVSNACISGLLAILIGQRLIRSGQFDHVVVSGADLLTKFVVSGFQSFQAVSDAPCRPFDAARNGITLGEGAATVVLTKEKHGIRLGEGASANDANHISGPSRTGAELASAIGKAIRRSGLLPEDIGFVSAHGTATLYNDEMEAKAFHLSGLQNVPVNSLKGYYGHTLGAAGLIETIISIRSMEEGIVLPTLGFNNSGVSVPLVLSGSILQKPMQHFLKTTSGFGGCNAAMVFSRESV